MEYFLIKRLTFILAAIILFLAVITVTVFAPSVYQYCPASTINSNYENIARVSLNGNEKISGNSTYSDFTNTTLTELNMGVQYTLYVDIKTTWNYNEFVKAWIDFNNNGNFSNDEEINLGNATFNGIYTFSKNFTVPSNLTPSETRMRVYLRYASAPFACKSTTSGEVEDYKIKLSLPIQACINGTTQSCGSGNCLGTQMCTLGIWGNCTTECDAIRSCQNKCIGNVRYYSGNCDLTSCGCSYLSTDNCDLQDGCYVYGNGCENRDYFCQPDTCNYTFSNRNTDSYDNFVNYCSADTIRTHRTFHDFGCDGTCKDHISWVNDSLVKDCNSQDGWYNTTIAWVNDTQNTEKEQTREDYRDYTCSNANCSYSVNNSVWVDTGRTRNKTSIKYCPVSIKSSCNSLPIENIARVSLNGNEKISGNSSYSDFTNATLTTLNAGMSYTLYADVKTPAKYTEVVKAWIDFNNDGNFSSNEEINLGNAQFYGNRTFNNTFTVPSNAVLSETRMRVYLKWAGVPSPCENATFGEIEDYTIKIL